MGLSRGVESVPARVSPELVNESKDTKISAGGRNVFMKPDGLSADKIANCQSINNHNNHHVRLTAMNHFLQQRPR